MPLAVVAPVSAVMLDTWDQYQRVGAKSAGTLLTMMMTGYDPQSGQLRTDMLKRGLIPIMIGGLVHKLAGRVGVNRALSGSGVPWIRI